MCRTGEYPMTITHGILLGTGTFYNLIHEMEEISKNDVIRENRKIDWKETETFDNSNPGRFQNIAIYRERWI